MGYYIDPPDMTKEAFLLTKGELLDKAPTIYKDGDRLAVCLINNRTFTAAGIMFSPRELQAFSDPNDHRAKCWFYVSREDLLPYYH